MGIGNYTHESIHDQKSIFLPMFCRLSIKDVKLSSGAASAADPSSPTVTCIGQVKRNHRIIPSTHHHHHKHTKPRKPVHFSTKTLLPNPPPNPHSGGRKSGSRSCRLNREVYVRDSRRSVGHREFVEMVIDVRKMDPPLPVVKRAAPPGNGREEVNIWRRRFEGVKSMQIEPIHLPEKRFPWSTD